MNPTINGIHHITAIASDPRRNVEFYTRTLGLRLVKKTVNFDDPSAYHLYYGDESGAPGSIVTFFYWPGHGAKGRVGVGQVTAITFSAPMSSLEFWHERLAQNDVIATRRFRFGEEVLAFSDPDGIPVEIVGTLDDARRGWSGGSVPVEHALRGLHSAELTVRYAAPTEALLTGEMGYTLVRREGNRARFAPPAASGSGGFVDVIGDPFGAPGSGGAGTIHHIAWRVNDDATEATFQTRLADAGFQVSTVRDRNYFRSIYYRERGGILFEIATDVPGFAVDEASDALGTALKLPALFEPHRHAIERRLPPLDAVAVA
jgi:glyoxalase family protein